MIISRSLQEYGNTRTRSPHLKIDCYWILRRDTKRGIAAIDTLVSCWIIFLTVLVSGALLLCVLLGARSQHLQYLIFIIENTTICFNHGYFGIQATLTASCQLLGRFWSFANRLPWSGDTRVGAECNVDTKAPTNAISRTTSQWIFTNNGQRVWWR